MDGADLARLACMLAARDLWPLLRKSVQAWNDDYAPSMGAALAYYTTFSLAPVLIIVIAVAGLVFGQEAARGEIVLQVGGLIGEPGAKTIEELLANASRPQSSVAASIVGLLTLLLGATSVFAELQSALDRIWRVPALPQRSGILTLVRARLWSFGMVVAMGFLLLVSLVIGAALSALSAWGRTLFPAGLAVLQALNLGLSFGVTALLFAMAYRILPRARIAWSDVWIGAVATAVLFTLGKYLIGLYLGRAAMSSGFGAAGSFVIILVWVYYSAQIFLVGAEFTWVFAHSHGSRSGSDCDKSRECSKTTPTSPPVPCFRTIVRVASARRVNGVSGSPPDVADVVRYKS
jgi:membrane protein